MLKINDPKWREISWEQALRAASPRIAGILEKALGGTNLDFHDGLALCDVAEDDLCGGREGRE